MSRAAGADTDERAEEESLENMMSGHEVPLWSGVFLVRNDLHYYECSDDVAKIKTLVNTFRNVCLYKITYMSKQ